MTNGLNRHPPHVTVKYITPQQKVKAAQTGENLPDMPPWSQPAVTGAPEAMAAIAAAGGQGGVPPGTPPAPPPAAPPAAPPGTPPDGYPPGYPAAPPAVPTVATPAAPPAAPAVATPAVPAGYPPGVPAAAPPVVPPGVPAAAPPAAPSGAPEQPITPVTPFAYPPGGPPGMAAAPGGLPPTSGEASAIPGGLPDGVGLPPGVTPESLQGVEVMVRGAAALTMARMMQLEEVWDIHTGELISLSEAEKRPNDAYIDFEALREAVAHWDEEARKEMQAAIAGVPSPPKPEEFKAVRKDPDQVAAEQRAYTAGPAGPGVTVRFIPGITRVEVVGPVTVQKKKKGDVRILQVMYKTVEAPTGRPEPGTSHPVQVQHGALPAQQVTYRRQAPTALPEQPEETEEESPETKTPVTNDETY